MSIYNNKSQEQFIQKAKSVHQDKYDYTLVEYQKSSEKVKIICSEHGMFEQRPGVHLRGVGCGECARKNRGKSIAYSQAEMIDQFKGVHGDKFDYSRVNYIRKDALVQIGCPHHGFFEMSPQRHLLSSRGCRDCSRDAMSQRFLTPLEDLIQRCRETHGDHYGYSLFPAGAGVRTKVPIICPVHGIFYQELRSHYLGCHCPKCCNHTTSSMSKEWLDSLSVPIREFPIGGNRKFVADGYDPDTNTIYEFNGDYWHGNPDLYEASLRHPVVKKSFGYLYSKTLERESYILSLGFNLITMWESDWKTRAL